MATVIVITPKRLRYRMDSRPAAIEASFGLPVRFATARDRDACKRKRGKRWFHCGVRCCGACTYCGR